MMLLLHRTRVPLLLARVSVLVKRQNALTEIVKPQLQTRQIFPLQMDQMTRIQREIQGDQI